MKMIGRLVSKNVYLRPKQLTELKNIQLSILERYKINISVSEIIRDAIDDFLEEYPLDEFENYLNRKGW